MSNISIEEFPVEINRIISEYVAGMLLADKLKSELDAIVEEPRFDITDVRTNLNEAGNGLAENYDLLMEAYVYEHIFVWLQFVTRMLGCNIFVYLDVWTVEHTDGDIQHGPIPSDFWVTGDSRIDERVAFECLCKIFEKRVRQVCSSMEGYMVLPNATMCFEEYIMTHPSWGTKNLEEELELFAKEDPVMGKVILRFIQFADEIIGNYETDSDSSSD